MNKANILIVDDNKQNLNFLTDYIHSLNYNVLSAQSGKQALNKIFSEKIDLVLLDLMMPEMNGFQVLEKLKEDDFLYNTPVVILSAIDNIDDIVKCIELGAIDYLTKPINSTLLKAKLKLFLDRKIRYDQEKSILKGIQSNLQSLQELEQVKADQVGMIIHDLNNPLSAIKGYTQVLGMIEKDGKKPNIDYLKKIGESILDMQTIIRDLLDLATLDNNKKILNATNFNVVELTRDIFQAFILQNKENIKCDYFCEMEESIIFCDRQLLSRVLNNLLINADKHTPPGSTIQFSVKKKEKLQIIVQDNGYGIPKNLQDNVFDKFFRVESKKQGVSYGFGLGLYFCKTAIEAMNGKIWVESEEEKGSKFIIEF